MNYARPPANCDDGVLSFVRNPALKEEADHHDGLYANQAIDAPACPESLRELWVNNPHAPFNRTLLRALGPLSGKDVVLLGNGLGVKELHLAALGPRSLVCSDLSPTAIGAVQRHFASVDLPQCVEWAAIDALDLPFADESVDVLYGYSFVHHLPDLDAFLAEVMRVLRPGGRAVFKDDAYCPLWQSAKLGPLQPLMRLAHRVNPISPEDQRHTREGGFQIAELAESIERLGGQPWFERNGVTHYFAARWSQIFAPRGGLLDLNRRVWISDGDRHRLRVPYGPLLRVLASLDAILARRFKRVRENQIRLAWGFQKP